MRAKILLLLVSAACSCVVASESVAQVDNKNTVVVMGMIHGRHRTSSKYGLEQVRSLIRQIDPDYVYCEIPPNRLDVAAKQFRETGNISEARVKVFPEYVEALFPLTKELKFEIVPCAGWTKEMADNRSRKLAELQTTQAEQFQEMTAAQTKADEMIAKESGGDDDPMFIHSDRYDEITKLGLEPYNRHFNEILGPGGWDNINKSHFGLVAAGLDKHSGQGKTILIMFGAGHKYWFMEQLRKRSDIKLVPLAKYLAE